eukprot:TRINITY_DN102687_c0_g1_i1.p1 TRINITY_DN102687_c0_g1~~TRINITY_DN102687_c0_g1_i1.p1  ORF type:complete len:502 (-),score=73.25 TRINITY_DN102687_c0_g1_i1:122-1480(-)
MGATQCSGELQAISCVSCQEAPLADCGASFSSNGSFGQKYTLGRLLGKGSQGQVYACLDRETKAEYAVKIIGRSDAMAWKTYQREVELLRASAGSRYLVGMLGEFYDWQNYYVVMEKFCGHLRHGIKYLEGRVEPEKTGATDLVGTAALRRITRQMLNAIFHLHSSDILHRDVKASNVLVDRLNLRDPQCRVVLADFGLARRLKVGQHLTAQVGTRKYWAPEVYGRKYHHTVDCFALGVVLFLLVTGKYPFLSEEETFNRCIETDEAKSLSAAAEEARDFMAQALYKKSHKRPDAFALMQHDFLLEDGTWIEDRAGSKCQLEMPDAVSPPHATRKFRGFSNKTIIEVLDDSLSKEFQEDVGAADNLEAEADAKATREMLSRSRLEAMTRPSITAVRPLFQAPSSPQTSPTWEPVPGLRSDSDSDCVGGRWTASPPSKGADTTAGPEEETVPL